MRMAGIALVSATVLFGLANKGLPGQAANGAEVRPSQIRTLLGKTAENHDGERLGKLVDFVVDLGSGDVRFALLSSGGMLGVGARLKIVPLALVSEGTVKKGTVSVDVTRGVWKSAPVFSRREIAGLDQAARAQEIYQHYGLAYTTNGAADTRMSAGNGSPLSATGRAPRIAESSPGCRRLATDLIGKQIVHEGKEIGKIYDVLADFSGQHGAFALVARAKALKHGEGYAIPLSILQASGGAQLQLNGVLPNAPQFTEKAWTQSERQIYRYTKL